SPTCQLAIPYATGLARLQAASPAVALPVATRSRASVPAWRTAARLEIERTRRPQRTGTKVQTPCDETVPASP
ncbi:MAG TPA: hypothetical protein VN961_00940, partial [Streptosporangiaceae bacterium]|nr:hypothetical protein [Streptosporangiaceae bacterium]